MLTYRARSACAPETAWALIARPDRWHEWAPHIRGADGLGSPEVHAGARGAVSLLGLVPVPVTITERGARSWCWRVGAVEFEHRVEPCGEECDVVITIEAPRPVEGALSVTYGPLVKLLVRNLARVAAAV